EGVPKVWKGKRLVLGSSARVGFPLAQRALFALRVLHQPRHSSHGMPSDRRPVTSCPSRGFPLGMWVPVAAALALVALGCAGAPPRPAAPKGPATTPAPAPARAPAPATPPALVPADVLDLSDWKLQLPIGRPGAVDEVRQPELHSFALP